MDVQTAERLERALRLRKTIVSAALDVHRALGPGSREAAYRARAPVLVLERVGRLDLLVDDRVVVEVKAVREPHPTFEAQVISYLKATGKPVGILLNFGVAKLLQGGYENFLHPAPYASRRAARADPSASSASSEP